MVHPCPDPPPVRSTDRHNAAHAVLVYSSVAARTRAGVTQSGMELAIRDYPHGTTVKPEKCRNTQQNAPPVRCQLSAYGGAPTPATVCVPHGVFSMMRAGALRSPTVSVAVRACLSSSSGRGCDREPKTVPCQW